MNPTPISPLTAENIQAIRIPKYALKGNYISNSLESNHNDIKKTCSQNRTVTAFIC